LIYGIADPEGAIDECNTANNEDSADDLVVRCNTSVY